MSAYLLLIEQQPLLPDADLVACSARLSGARWERIAWRDDAPPRLEGPRPDLLLLEAGGSADRVRNGLRWLERAAGVAPAFAVLPDGIAEDLLSVASRTLDDFVLWPAPVYEVRERLARVLSRPGRALATVQDRLTAEMALRNLVGQDPAFRALVAKLPRLGQSDRNVLITGETGTGKEVFARALHYLSPRAGRPFLPVNCGAIPIDLFESELFGHEKGAFTGASLARGGLVAEADTGTLFLDEIETLSLGAQVKLLRFLEDRTYHVLGSSRPRTSNVRIVAATNAALGRKVREGSFREDLFYRLGVLALTLPPLRERRGDVPLLAAHFLARLGGADGAEPKRLSPGALEALGHHAWPGNVRELQNVIQQAVVLAEHDDIEADDLSIPPAPEPAQPRRGAMRQAKARAVEEFEKRYVGELLDAHHGNVTRAAHQAQKDRRAFGRLVKKYYPPPA